MSRLRRAGSPWRILVHEYTSHGHYGDAHHITNDANTFGRAPTHKLSAEAKAHLEQVLARRPPPTVLPRTEFDELVIGRWIHLEAMGNGRWWINIGGVTIWADADREGRPTAVCVYGPGDYADPVDGVTYECTWTSEEATDA